MSTETSGPAPRRPYSDHYYNDPEWRAAIDEGVASLPPMPPELIEKLRGIFKAARMRREAEGQDP